MSHFSKYARLLIYIHLVIYFAVVPRSFSYILNSKSDFNSILVHFGVFFPTSKEFYIDIYYISFCDSLHCYLFPSPLQFCIICKFAKYSRHFCIKVNNENIEEYLIKYQTWWHYLTLTDAIKAAFLYPSLTHKPLSELLTSGFSFSFPIPKILSLNS